MVVVTHKDRKPSIWPANVYSFITLCSTRTVVECHVSSECHFQEFYYVVWPQKFKTHYSTALQSDVYISLSLWLGFGWCTYWQEVCNKVIDSRFDLNSPRLLTLLKRSCVHYDLRTGYQENIFILLWAKGQLISKWLFGVFNFFQKWTKTIYQRFHSSKV